MTLPKVCPCSLKTSRASSKIRKWNAGVSNFLRTLHFWCVDSNRPVPSQGLKKKESEVKFTNMYSVCPWTITTYALGSVFYLMIFERYQNIHTLLSNFISRCREPALFFDVSKQMFNLMEAFFKFWCLLRKPKLTQISELGLFFTYL